MCRPFGFAEPEVLVRRVPVRQAQLPARMGAPCVCVSSPVTSRLLARQPRRRRHDSFSNFTSVRDSILELRAPLLVRRSRLSGRLLFLEARVETRELGDQSV